MEVPSVCFSGELAKKLYAHQVDGVKWLWRLQETGSGGILADDMGLGKVSVSHCAFYCTHGFCRLKTGEIRMEGSALLQF